MSILIILGAGGGIIAILSAVIIIGRGIFHQVTVTEDLTGAVKELSMTAKELRDSFTRHETRISVLEDRAKR